MRKSILLAALLLSGCVMHLHEHILIIPKEELDSEEGQAYLDSIKAATGILAYRAGDPDWDESWPDDELEGGAYLDSAHAGRTADKRCGNG